MKPIDVCENACLEAGKIALKHFQNEFEVRHKGRIDLVSAADLECEKKIKETISKAFPEHSFLAEESGSSGSSDTVWVIDPIDGTTNFVHGIDYFCHSVALEKNGVVVCGCVYNPVHKKMFSAELGRGAKLNGKKICVSRVSKLLDGVVVTGFPYENNIMGEKAAKSVVNIRGKCQGLRRFGAAALDLCSVASGVCDGFFEYVLSPWDVGAGMLILSEAGGKTTDINGVPASIRSGNFLASNGLIHDELKSYLERV